MRKIVTRFYDDSGEPELVRRALTEAWVKEQGHSDTDVSSNAVLTKLHQWGYVEPLPELPSLFKITYLPSLEGYCVEPDMQAAHRTMPLSVWQLTRHESLGESL